MAIIAIGRNGIGLGHFSRMAALCTALADKGETPVLLAQGHRWCALPRTLPVGPCPYFSDLTTRERDQWRKRVEAYAHLSNPAVVIEDTHPIGFRFSRQVRRVLLV